ncbi:hypothetical protein ACP4OV_029186 [Aristida adscensionis]
MADGDPDPAAPPPKAELAAAAAASTSPAPSRPPPAADLEPSIARTRVRDVLAGGAALFGRRVVVGGWVRTGRVQGGGAFAFLAVSDGSCLRTLQVVVRAAVAAAPLARLTPAGTSVLVEGVLRKPPDDVKHLKEAVELHVERVVEVGEVDAAAYPLPKTKKDKEITMETLRGHVHLRARTNIIAAVARIRHQLACATHKFFDENGFLYVHTPIITTSDCEGAGEMFQVTTLFSQAERLREHPQPSEADIDAARLVVREKADAVAQLKAANASRQEIAAAVLELKAAKENVSELEERFKLRHGIPYKDDGTIAFENDFFKRQAFLTVSGQLQVETYACALSSVYTFGPTFRAENSHTSRHLAEFWMVEPEIAFANLQDDMNCAENYVQYLCKWLLQHCREDIEFIGTKVRTDARLAIDRLELVSSTPFERISYTRAVEILKNVQGHKFESTVEWGIDLASEHERYLTEVIFKKPVIVYNYPRGIKAFYMRLNDDMQTVAAMDVLVPQVGELIGGSQREERLDVLKQRILDAGLPLEPYEWYLDLRRFGSVKHSGFGLGFERMILFATDIENIRDVIPFPRYPGRADL